MNENENVGLDDFENALFGDDYQFGDEDGAFEDGDTDSAEDDDVIDDLDESKEVDDDADTDHDGEGEPDEADSGDDEAEEEEEGDHAAEGDGATFTLKVNKEERQVTLEEMTTLAQKGADYDRVKKQYTDSQQTIQDLQKKLEAADSHRGVYEILDIVAEKTGTKLEELAEMLYLNIRSNEGASEALAKEELKRAKVEKELDGFKSQKAQTEEKKDDAESRAQREIEAFKNDYPDVALTDELLSKLTPDLQKGKSLSSAYRAMEKAQSEAKIKELEQKLAAKEQNDKNKKHSPGSQKDSGGRRSRSEYDEFERALFG